MSEQTFLQRLQTNQPLISDGATGTNLQQRGLMRGAPAESWLFEKPQEIVRLHLDFLQAGAEILLTNTFGASPLRLESVGRIDFEQANRRAVELARKAIEAWEAKQDTASSRTSTIYIAGSIGPSGQLIQPIGPLSENQVLESFTAQAKALSEAGVDLLVIETQFDLNEAEQALRGARSASALPIVVSFSYDRGTRSMMGVRPAQMSAHFMALGADVLGVNCGRSLEENLQALHELRAATDLPLWFKPNAGLPGVDSQGNTVYAVTPEQMGSLAPQWIAAGAQVVGGCCGTSPAHLAEIARYARSG